MSPHPPISNTDLTSMDVSSTKTPVVMLEPLSTILSSTWRAGLREENRWRRHGLFVKYDSISQRRATSLKAIIDGYSARLDRQVELVICTNAFSPAMEEITTKINQTCLSSINIASSVYRLRNENQSEDHFKKQVYELAIRSRYQILQVIESSPQAAEMWNSLGLPVTLWLDPQYNVPKVNIENITIPPARMVVNSDSIYTIAK